MLQDVLLVVLGYYCLYCLPEWCGQVVFVCVCLQVLELCGHSAQLAQALDVPKLIDRYMYMCIMFANGDVA